MLAVDFGASSGRAMLGSFNGEKLTIQEVHRFANEPVQLGGNLHWDFLRLFHELKTGIHLSKLRSGVSPASIAVDTWGVDYGLVDRKGRLVGNPYHYRDSRTDSTMNEVFGLISEDELYKQTGIQSSQINTIFQLYTEDRIRSFQHTDQLKMLFMPDLFHYYLSGVMANEYTIASTSGLLNPINRNWNIEIMDTLNIPSTLFSDIVAPGTKLGSLRKAIGDELHVGAIPIVAACGHDTASALVSVPTDVSHYAFISSGTWSIMGMELDEPILSVDSRQSLFSNEGGAEHKIRLLKNIMGLWLLQECRRAWALEGTTLNYDELTQMALSAPQNGSYIDADDVVFLPPGGMPKRIQEYCRASGQIVPESRAEIVRCIVESLAFKYKQTLTEMEKLSGKRLEHIYMVGGGIQNRLLCQLTASVTGKPVIAGPVEATAIGNMMMQAKAHGEVKDLSEIRGIVKQSFPPEIYHPEDTAMWEERYERYLKLFVHLS